MDNHQSKKFALCSDRGCGGSGVVRRMSIIGYGGGKFRDGMLLVEGGISTWVKVFLVVVAELEVEDL